MSIGKRWRLAAVGLASAGVAAGCARPGSMMIDRRGPERVLASEEFLVDPLATPTGRVAGGGLDGAVSGRGVGNGGVGNGGGGGRAGWVLGGGGDGAIVLPPFAGVAGGAGGVGSGARLGAADAAGVLEAGPGLAARLAVVAGAPGGDGAGGAGDGGGGGLVELVDAKIGEVNGRAILLSELVVEYNLGPRLEALAERVRRERRPREAWVGEARRVVGEQLMALLTDELLMAEGRASLSASQRQGLRAFIAERQEDIRRVQGAGSRVEAQRQLAEAGTSEQEILRREESRVLIMYQLEQKIESRVRVSWKDIRLHYERNFERYNPPPTARLRMIRVSGTDEAGASRVTERLAGGEAFSAVARDPANVFRAAEGGALPEVGLKELRESGPFPRGGRLEVLNAAVKGLMPGEVAGPIEVVAGGGRELAWVMVEEVVEVRRPLSDREVQLEIVQEIQRERELREREAYIRRLMERASFTSMDEMVERVVWIVGERVWPRG